MAKKKGGNKPQRRRAAPRPSFFFEAGEKSLNLPVRTSSCALGPKGEAPGFKIEWQSDGVPTHLRCVGQRVKLSVLGADNKIVHGTAVEPVRTFVLKEDDDEVLVTLIGLPSTVVRWTMGTTLYYKDV